MLDHLLRRLASIVVWAGAASCAYAQQGSGITIELEKSFVEKFKDRATIEADFKPIALSKVHAAKKDGEVHVAGKLASARLPGC